ncbi:Tyrosine-protein phosphatase non-receptor type 3 [Blomia tropicalis]|nr:Tyrosine-protein phosphatase non-receptor type 3 [Blomia tropicalis]
MSRNFMAALSGTYNVHANELAQGGSNQNVATNTETIANVGTSSGTTSLLPAAFAKLVRQQTIQPSSPPQIETIKCVVHFLDDTQHIFEVDRTAKGEELLDLVFRHLELIEREFFALQFTEVLHHCYDSNSFLNGSISSSSPSSSISTTVYNRWLDPNKKIKKQLRFTSSPYMLNFRVKFYASEVSRLFEEYTRYHFYLQLRKDILAGRLSGEESTLALLASYVLQSELGDYGEDEHKPGYASQFRYIPSQSKQFEAKAESLHRLHQGQTPADAEMNYLEEAKNLDLYGVDLHPAKDCEGENINIGVSSNGLTIFKQSIHINNFSWAKIVKISFKRRFFFVQLKHEGTERFDNVIGFNLCSHRACKTLWKTCVEQHTFFRLHSPKPLTKKFFFFFSLGSKFRYSGKTEFQTIEENKKRLTRTERIFIRNNVRHATMPASTTNINDAQKHLTNLRMTNNEKNLRKPTKLSEANIGSNGAMSSSSSLDSLPPTPPSSTIPISIKISEPHMNGSNNKSLSSRNSSVLTAITVGKKHNICTQQSGQLDLPFLSQQISSRSSSMSSNSSHHQKTDEMISDNQIKKNVLSLSSSCDNIQGYNRIHMTNGHSGTKSHRINGINCHDINHRVLDSCDGDRYHQHKTTPKICSLPTSLVTTGATTAYSPSTMISMPYIDQDKVSVVVGPKTTSNILTIEDDPSLTIDDDDNIQSQTKNQMEKEVDSPIRELIKELYDVAATESARCQVTTDDSPEESSTSSPVHLATVTMKPDDEGRFGFNVKGGFDQNCPVLVSRVAPNTPADNAYPTKLREGDQVISINGVEVSQLKHEEVVQLIRSTKSQGPEAELVLSIRPNVFHHQCDEEIIEEPPFQYTVTVETISQEIGNMLIESNEWLPFNSDKTLLDISMSLLQEGLESESLIVQFEQLYRRNEKEPITIARLVENIPKNRYLDIAPYDSTRVILDNCITGDYINASYVTMAIEASGTVNKYIATQGPLKRTASDFWLMVWEKRCSVIVMVTPLVEDGRKKCFKYWPDDSQACLTKESHYVTHLQYLAWPDQGVPDDDADFLKLIFKVRLLRHANPDAHVVVHCSAGIGRTGVLILMETGICLIEANQPIYPVELVRQMRCQRAMLIQTTMQFRFVCEALHHVYKDQVVQPLPQYSCIETLEDQIENQLSESIEEHS